MGKMTAADGNPVTNSGCGSTGVHNGSECGVLQTDTLVPELDGVPWYWADYVAHPNGLYGLWLKFIMDPSCKVESSGLYADGGVPGAGYTPDEETVEKLSKYWNVGECGTPGIPTYLTITIDGTKHLATRGADDPVTGYPTWTGTNLTIDWFDSAVDYWRITYAGSLSDYDTSSPIPPEGSWDNMSPSTATVFVEWGNTLDPVTHEGEIVTHEGEYLYS